MLPRDCLEPEKHVMFPKHPRIKNKKLISEMKQEITMCELCGGFSFSASCLEAAHIKSKGSSGPDMRENIVVICGPANMQKGCHGMSHKGKIPQERLWEVAARREGITVEECKQRVRRAMGYE